MKKSVNSLMTTLFMFVPLLQACRPVPLLLLPRPSYHTSTAAALLSLLDGGPVPPSLASRLLSCFRFLVPAQPKSRNLIHWPPSALAELARQVVESGGDPSVVLNSLSGDLHPVPDVEGAGEQRCQLTKCTYGHRFKKKELNQYMAFLFEAIAALAPSVGFNVTLNRFDLFHGHLFLAGNTGRLGILFHAREYPAFNEEKFPVHLGYCQVGSSLVYDESVNFRNILWLAPMPDYNNTKRWAASGSLLVLDAHPEGIIFKDLVSEDVDIVRTIYEDDFGIVVVDVNYLSLVNVKPEDRIYIC